jgi:RNA polymerase sigma factor (sigma-70 family)
MQHLMQNNVNDSLDHLFRQHSGQMVSVLSRLFGIEKIDLIEDAIQDSMIQALKFWSIKGIPQNPMAWLIQVAKNKIIDDIRRNKIFEFDNDEIEKAENYLSKFNLENSVRFANEINEDVLQMIFACCNPKISPNSQVALTLKIVSGFSVSEIASAFLSNNEAVGKILSRAKQTLKQNNVRFTIESPKLFSNRLNAAIKVLYLMFNEGYNSFNSNDLIKNELCFEAIRLAKLLTNFPLTNEPKVHALLALFLFQAARLNARFDENGDILLISEQNRAIWNKKMIAEALMHLRLSASGTTESEIHIEAEIASLHTLAKDFESTNWQRIFVRYQDLHRLISSPIVALNKIVALSKIKNAQIALDEIKKPELVESLKDYLPFYITLAELEIENKRFADARNSLNKALSLTNNETLRRFITKKLNENSI